MLLPNRILRARAHAKQSQAQLARRIGVSRGAISQWESARGSSPSSANLALFARFCDVSFEWLATGRGPMLRDGVESPAEAAHMQEFVYNDAELRLLTNFRRLSRSKQSAVTNLVTNLLSASD
ncbi:MAG: helix-turn-helix transcriptional regulator [Nitrospira sp.]|nr:helix-turn-helix transcriptional regulator [Nitrospira sp.]MBS0194367.1 helix-turn-helix transcriptional regulator [Pseudomonadota bacterium]